LLFHGVPAFISSIGFAAAVLFGVGVIKARVADTHPWRSGMETFVIGALAGGLGYVLGVLIPKAFGVNFVGG
jgi:VIT1/CCC1 family predicted Fe2+/Mn2+ transporter